MPLRDMRSAISTSSGRRTGQECLAPNSRRFLEGVELRLHLIEAEEVRGRAVTRPAQVLPGLSCGLQSIGHGTRDSFLKRIGSLSKNAVQVKRNFTICSAEALNYPPAQADDVARSFAKFLLQAPPPHTDRQCRGSAGAHHNELSC